MTIPPDFEFPPSQDEDPSAQFANMDEMYRTISTGLNGIYLTSEQSPPLQWKPTIGGGLTSGDVTYTRQDGLVYKQGPLVDCWFYVAWSAQSGNTGNIFVLAPYKSARTLGSLQSGVANLAGMTWGNPAATCTNCTIQSNDYGIYFQGWFQSGSNADIPVQNSGLIVGHIRYIGVSNDHA